MYDDCETFFRTNNYFYEGLLLHAYSLLICQREAGRLRFFGYVVTGMSEEGRHPKLTIK